jgi:uncharacterized integral membrane protein
MVRLIRWFLTALVTVIVVVFAIANRQAVTVWPLPDDVPVPLAIIVVVVLFLGFFAGWLAAWISGLRWRREARHRERRITALEQELVATQAQLRAETPPSGGLPPSRAATR